MKLLVSGGLGFIGSNFIIKLLKESNDYEILNIDAELYGADHRNLSQIENSEKYEFIKGNITNKKFMEEQIKKCDAVVNFAAESFVDRSISDANPFLVSNIRGAFTILDIITKEKNHPWKGLAKSYTHYGTNGYYRKMMRNVGFKEVQGRLLYPFGMASRFRGRKPQDEVVETTPLD